MEIEKLKIDSGWSLFLDRDGVINKRLMGDYVKSVEEFEILPNVPKAISDLSKYFSPTVIVTNQQGIGKGLMTVEDLNKVHQVLKNEVEIYGGHIDAIYFAPQLASENSSMRKPKIGMALKAKEDFGHIDFSKSIMVGDTKSDMEFGRNAGMKTVLIGRQDDINPDIVDFAFEDLYSFSKSILKQKI
jgi:histidinol-phosphate phosphatase family protein